MRNGVGPEAGGGMAALAVVARSSDVRERSERMARPSSTTAEAVVRVSGLRKRFPIRRPLLDTLRAPTRRNWRTVLDAVSLEVHAGELFGLLGPNGAGKTTLFKILATLVAPDSGSVWVAGHDAAADPAAVRRVLTPVVADERSLNWRLSGRENLRLYAGLYGLRGAAATTSVDRLLGTVGLEDAADRMVGAYSSGMRQRLLIARALLSGPRVLLLDEPTRSLDPVSARDLRRFIRDDVVRRAGCTVLLATHDAEEAFGLCDRVAVLDRGRLVATGQASELARHVGGDRYTVSFRSERVRDFLSVSRRCGVVDLNVSRAGPGEWVGADGTLPGGQEAASRWLTSLVAAGIEVAELTPRRLELAELIECLTGTGGGHA